MKGSSMKSIGVILLAVIVTTHSRDSWEQIKEQMEDYGVNCTDLDINKMTPCAFTAYAHLSDIQRDADKCRFNCSYLDSLITCIDEVSVRDECFETFKANSHAIIAHVDSKFKTNCSNFKNVQSIEEICPKHIHIGNPTTVPMANTLSVDCQWGAWMEGACSVTCGPGFRLRARFSGTPDNLTLTDCGVASEVVSCEPTCKDVHKFGTLSGWAIGLLLASVVVVAAIVTGVAIIICRRKKATTSESVSAGLL